MVNPSKPAAESSQPADDEAALMLAIAEHHEATAAALHQMVDGRALLRWLPAGGGSR